MKILINVSELGLREPVEINFVDDNVDIDSDEMHQYIRDGQMMILDYNEQDSVLSSTFKEAIKDGRFIDKYGNYWNECKIIDKDTQKVLEEHFDNKHHYYRPENTSRKQVPALFKKIQWQTNTNNLDIGGGKYDLASNYVAQFGVKNWIYDPFANKDATNKTREFMKNHKFDTITIANCFNVIVDESEIFSLIGLASRTVKKNGKVYISVYEGDKSGVGKWTTDLTWQHNKKLRWYLRFVGAKFNNVLMNKNYIECSL
jgi:hypothetical protein